MTLNKKERNEIIEDMKDIFRAGIMEVATNMSRSEIKKVKTIDDYKQETAKKLYSYPHLKSNVAGYMEDLKNLNKEVFGSAPAVHIVNTGGQKMAIEELRYHEAIRLRKKIIRDEKIIKEIDRALDSVRQDPYYAIIEMFYFKKMKMEEIAAKLNCDIKTTYTNRAKLLNIIMLKFYGGDVIEAQENEQAEA